MDEAIVNKVSESGLITLDPSIFLETPAIASFDLKDFLFRGLILKEKEFRQAIRDLDPTPFIGLPVAVYCSADAIIPSWAFMLVAARLKGIAGELFSGPPEELRKQIILKRIEEFDTSTLEGARVVIKGCGEAAGKEYLYLALTSRLLPLVRSIMYGEPCSTVPVFKRQNS